MAFTAHQLAAAIEEVSKQFFIGRNEDQFTNRVLELLFKDLIQDVRDSRPPGTRFRETSKLPKQLNAGVSRKHATIESVSHIPEYLADRVSGRKVLTDIDGTPVQFVFLGPRARDRSVSGTNEADKRLYFEFQHQAFRPEAISPSTITGPHELRPVPITFTGRDAFLADLVQLVSESALAGVAVRGLAGVGKTTFALAFAERLSSTYSSQVFLDLRGNTTTPLTPFEIMAHVVHAYRGGQRIPSAPADLSGLYYTILNEQHALLVFDNARDAAQIQAVLPPKNCFLLVTSRHRFALPTLHPVDLDPLRPSAARELLIALAPRCAEHADTLAELCGYLPIALCAAGNTLAQISNVTPADYVRRFRERRRRLELIDPASDVNVQASLALTHSLLPRPIRRRFNILGVFRDSFEAPAARAIWRTSTAVTEETLRLLTLCSLLTYDDSSNRYLLHDLVSAYADTNLSLLRRHVVATRHTIYFADMSTRLDTACSLSQGPAGSFPLQVFNREWPNIEVAFVRLARWMPNILAEVLDGCRSCLALSRPPADRLRWLRAVAGRGPRPVRARLLADLAIAYFDSAEPEQAADCARRALELSTKAHDAFGKELATNALTRAELALGTSQSAIPATEAALKTARAKGDVDGLKASLRTLGSNYRRCGSFSEALRCFEELLTVIRQDSNPTDEVWTLENIARTLAAIGDLPRAIAYAEREYELARQNEIPGASSTACGFLALQYERLGNRDRAATLYTERLATLHGVRSNPTDIYTVITEALAWSDADYPDRALAFAETALQLSREQGFREMESFALFALGGIYGRVDNDESAKRCFLDAARVAESSGHSLPEALAKWVLSLMAIDEGNFSRTALIRAERALAIVDKGYGGIFSRRPVGADRLRDHIRKLQAEQASDHN